MQHCNNAEEFVEALAFELTTDNPGVIPGDYTGYLRRCLKWRDEGADDVHADCIAAADHTALEDEIKELKEDLEEAKEEDEKRSAYIQTLEDRLLDFGDTAPAPNLLRVATRDAVKTLRALLPALDAAKFNVHDRKRLRMSLYYAAEHLEAATRKTEDEPEEQTEPAAPVWYPTACMVDGESVPFRWQREPIRTPKGATTGHITRIAWAPMEGVGAEVTKSRWYSGNTAATLQVWQGGEEAIADEDDRTTLYAQAAVLEACLPEAR